MLRATLLSSHLIRALGFPDGSVWAFLMFRHDMERFEMIHNVDGDGISLVDWLYLSCTYLTITFLQTNSECMNHPIMP
jgi:hypothetical protein